MQLFLGYCLKSAGIGERNHRHNRFYLLPFAFAALRYLLFPQTLKNFALLCRAGSDVSQWLESQNYPLPGALAFYFYRYPNPLTPTALNNTAGWGKIAQGDRFGSYSYMSLQPGGA